MTSISGFVVVVEKDIINKKTGMLDFIHIINTSHLCLKHKINLI